MKVPIDKYDSKSAASMIAAVCNGDMYIKCLNTPERVVKQAFVRNRFTVQNMWDLYCKVV